MASMLKIERMLGKAILDDKYRKLLMEDPDAAAKQVGATLTAAQRVSIQNMREDVFAWWAEGFKAAKSSDTPFLW